MPSLNSESGLSSGGTNLHDSDATTIVPAPRAHVTCTIVTGDEVRAGPSPKTSSSFSNASTLKDGGKCHIMRHIYADDFET